MKKLIINKGFFDKNLKKGFLAFVLVYTINAFGQNANEIVLSELAIEKQQYKGDLDALVNQITSNCETELEKARAIFVWITGTIAYDSKALLKKRKAKIIKCKTEEICNQKRKLIRDKIIRKALSKKKGVCEAYANLYKKMCDLAEIPCDLVYGYTKTEPNQIGRMGTLDHVWNRIYIDGHYYYLDATWGAGYLTEGSKKYKKFVKSRDDYFWLTPIDDLSRTHFPKDTLQLSESNYSKLDYKNNPVFATEFTKPLVNRGFFVLVRKFLCQICVIVWF